MLNLFITAAKYRDLVALVLSTWTTMHPGHAPPREGAEVASAIAFAVLEQPEAGPYDDETEAALLAVFADRESSVRAHPCAHTSSPTCGDSGHAHGYWQLWSASESDRAQRQAEVWLALLRYAGGVCPERPLAVVASGSCDHGTRIAIARLKEAQDAVNAWHAQQSGGSPQAPAPSATAADPAIALRAAAVAPTGHP